MNIEKCKKCNKPNLERYWLQIGDQWVCAYCYNGTYTQKQIDKIRGIKND